MSEKADAWLAMILMPLVVVWEGYVVATMWAWFFVSTFQLPALSIPQAIGIVALINLVTHQHIQSNNDEMYLVRLRNAAIAPLVVLVIGFVAREFL